MASPQSVANESEQVRKGRLLLDHSVFWPSVGTLLLLVLFTAFAPDASNATFAAVQSWIVEYASWYYVIVVALILVAIVVVSVSRFGDIKLGPDHATPDYSYVSWFSMLFAAGMGIGLMFFGVAEPVMHFLSPPHGAGGGIPAASEAMKLTFFHWGVHAWAIYALAALILGYFSYRHRLPLTLRSAFYPLIGERIHGPAGAAIDVFAIVCTTCGVATSLGLGVLQINSGMNYLLGVPITPMVQVGLIIGTMSLATVSVVMGLDAGIKRLSEINIALSIMLLIGVLLAGPTILLLQTTIENLGNYVGEIVTKTFNLYAYDPTDWLGGWTIFYWGWWLSWSPFVGLFIARISRGRTIREFVLGAMLVPCGFTLLWMGIFGNSAIDLILHGGQAVLGEAVQENQAVALFRFLEYLPMSTVLSVISLMMVVVFFVTSADSGAMVLNMLSAGGRDDTPAYQRVLWTAIIALIAICLLLAGGLSALQTAAIATALPFSVALLGATWGFIKALRLDRDKRDSSSVIPLTIDAGDWRHRLDSLLTRPSDTEVNHFLRETGLPAIRVFADALKERGVPATIADEIEDRGRVRLETEHEGSSDFQYEIRAREHHSEDPTDLENPDDAFYRAEVHLAEGGQGYDVMNWREEQLLHDMLQQYEAHMNFLQSLR
jgi:choline/glycine/proline betaine transport protein